MKCSKSKLRFCVPECENVKLYEETKINKSNSSELSKVSFRGFSYEASV